MKTGQKMKNRSRTYNINRTKSRHGRKCTKYKISQCNDGYVQ